MSSIIDIVVRRETDYRSLPRHLNFDKYKLQLKYSTSNFHNETDDFAYILTFI
ncbi:unnamed protein product [Tenebrio molitor]|nr:unnamed protein product [Tenebrio molitor]